MAENVLSTNDRRRQMTRLLDDSSVNGTDIEPISLLSDNVDLTGMRPPSQGIVQPVEMKDSKLSTTYKLWRATGNKSDLSAILNDLSPICASAIRSSGSVPSPKTMLMAKAKAASAVQSYKPGAGTTLETWVHNQLAALKRDIRQGASAIKVSDTRAQLKYKIDSASRELEDNLGRPATLDEIADKIHVNQRLIRKYQNLAYEMSTDLETSMYDSIVPADAEDRIRRVVYDAMLQSAASPEDQLIIEKMYDPEGPKMTATAVAHRLGISSAAVSKRRAKIGNRIDTLVGKLVKSNA